MKITCVFVLLKSQSHNRNQIILVSYFICCCWVISKPVMIWCYIDVIFLDGLSVMRRGLSTWRPSFRTTRRTWPLRTLLPRSSHLPPATGQREVQVRHRDCSFIFLYVVGSNLFYISVLHIPVHTVYLL